MSQGVVLALYLIAAALILPCAVLFIECLAGALAARGAPPSNSRRPRPRIAVLIPAHDEEGTVGSAIGSVKPQLRGKDRLLVVADNCSDGTAEVARRAGAEVVERSSSQGGKGYALAHGVDALRSDPPETVVVLDADMRMGEGSLDALGGLTAATGRPAQGFDLLDTPANPGPRDLVSALSHLVRNHRQRGLARLGLPCQLMGTGMALPWSSISGAQLMTSNLVEDLQLGLDLAVKGHAPIFCPTARVTGRLPQLSAAALDQRTRWEHGHLQTILTQAPRLLGEAVQQRRLDLLALALDLLVPPTALLMLLLLVTGLGAALVVALTGLWGPAIVSASGLLLLGAAVLMGWWTTARSVVPFRSLLGVPLYLLWKLPLYLRFILRPQKRWVRTARDQ